MDPSRIAAFVEQAWDQSIIPELIDYIRNPQ